MYNIYMQKTITKFLILTIILTAALSVNYLFAAWVGPTQAPPGGNTSTPVHVGSTDQIKEGGLSLDALSVFGGGYFQGNVGINTVTPSSGGEQNLNLDVEGAIGAGYYCDEDGNNCTSAPLGGGTNGWIDVTADTNPWDTQCDYKVQVVSGCGTHNGDVVFIGAIFTLEGYIFATAGHFLYVHYSNKGINVPAGSEAMCGSVPVKTYERC